MDLKKKKDIVKQLLNKNYEVEDEEQLIEIILGESISIDSDKYEDEKRTLGDRLSDKVTEIFGSWFFIACFLFFLFTWMALNYSYIITLDPYPFILLNLILSCIAALQAPIIMMSQNRAAKKDSLRSKNDYKTDLKSELILEILHEQIQSLEKNQKKILKYIEEKENIEE